MMTVRRALLGATVLVVATSGPLLGGTHAAGAAGGTVSGTVFRDYSADGARGSREPGEAAIVLTAYDSTGSPVATTTSAADGSYSLNVVSSASTEVRVELTIPTAKQGYLQPAPIGADNVGSVRFTTLGATAALFGVHNPGEYCQANPSMVSSCFVYGAHDGTQASYGTLKSFPYSASGALFNATATATPTTLSTFGDVGAVFGLAYSREDGATYAAAFQKQYSGFGPGGPGAIYRISGGTTTTLATIPSAGSDSRSALSPNASSGPAAGDPWLADASFDDVGKVGLGGIAMTDADARLWAVNLNDRQLYPVDVATGAVGTPVAIPLGTGATTACTATTDVRPFALVEHDGLLYVGETCTAQSTNDQTKLAMYVYSFDPSMSTFSAAPVFESAIPASPKGKGGNGCDASPAHWFAWETTDLFKPGTKCAYPQPWLTTVAFDRGNLILGLRDRFGDESGEDYPTPLGTKESVIAGDLLRACGSPAAGWTLESNATCGSITTAGTNNGQGPGGGEYYFNERFQNGGNHQETSNGGALQVPGFAEVAVTVMDPDQTDGGDWRAGGVHYENNDTGENGHWFQLYDKCDSSGNNCPVGRSKVGAFGKASGLGTLVALCDRAPIEIGNRVWLDANHNGRQDPGESPLAGITVTLYAADATTAIASAATDAQGIYTFSSDTTRTTAGGHVYGISQMTRGAQVVVGVATTATAAPYGTVTLTGAAASAASALTDSDVSAVTGKTALITLGGAGHNNHDLDIGYAPAPTTVGDYVWIDSNHDGLQNEPAANGVNGVTATLQTAAGGPVTDLDGNPVNPHTTANNPVGGAPGYYRFPNLPPGSYRVVFSNLPSVFVPTVSNAGADDAIDSDGLTTAPVTVTLASPQDLTLDLGLFAPVAVGDFVWFDANGNGVQDSGEPGIAGATVTLLDHAGTPVTLDADGAPIVPATTGADGHYGFSNLVPGTYELQFDPPSGYVATITHGGTDQAADSDAPIATSRPLAANESDLTLDAGFVPASSPPTVGSVTCDVYVDANHNGVHDPGETPLSGVTIQLIAANGTVVATATTGADGTCRLDGVPPGTYVLHEQQPNGYGSTTVNDITVGVSAGAVAQAAAYGEVVSSLPTTGAVVNRLITVAGWLCAAGVLLLLLPIGGQRRRPVR